MIKLIRNIRKTLLREGKTSDHDQFKWVDPKTLFEWKLGPADVPLAKSIIKI